MNDDEIKETRLDKIRKELADKPEDTKAGTPSPVYNLAGGLNRSIETPDEKPIDLIKEQIAKGKLLIGKGAMQVEAAAPTPGATKDDITLPPLPSLPPIVIDGHEFKRTNVPALDALTVLMYLVSTVLSDNPRVRSILDQVKFNFPDSKGVSIYPRSIKKTKKRKHKSHT